VLLPCSSQSRATFASTRKCVAGNPNTPLAVLNDIGEEYPRTFLLNPAFPVMSLENPSFLENIHQSILAKILEQEECP